jgi:CheY-like chemotaxis protein
MSDGLISLRILLLSRSAAERDLLRRGAVAASVPVEVVEAESIGAVPAQIAGNIDVVLADTSITEAERADLIAHAGSMERKPFLFVVAATLDEAQATAGGGADGVVVKPADVSQAKKLIERCARPRLPNRVLVVDDSLTMRSIVRKILVASRFRLDMSEAQEGIDALKQIATGRFDLVFLDYNMPGINGVETLAAIKRQHPDLHVVLMSSTKDDAIAEQARRAGAAAFLKKPFYPADIDAVLHRIFVVQGQ